MNTHPKFNPIIFALTLISLFVLSSCSRETVKLPPKELKVSKFKEISSDFKHRWDEVTHPFLGAAAIDVNNDGKMEVFIGGNNQQEDALLYFENNKMLNRISGTNLSSLVSTYGAQAIDFNNDGATDLIIARDDGVYIYLNNPAQLGTFSQQKISELLLSDSEAPFAVAVADTDQDGDGDLYVSVFVKFKDFRSATYNSDEHAKKNHFLRNDGYKNGKFHFTDITQESGTASLNNTFISTFSDLDKDGQLDIVVAQNTGQVEIFSNQGNNKFKQHIIPTGYGFWMGLAVGDYDSDGDQDLFFSNSGNSIPDFLTSGDLKDEQHFNGDWILLRNDGNFNFSEQTKKYGLKDLGFGWGGTFEDINLDGKLDLLVAQNYIKWPIHQYIGKLPGKAMIYYEKDDKPFFYHVDDLGLNNENFGQSHLIVDVNHDNKPDIVMTNMDGKVRTFLQQSKNHFITLAFKDNLKNIGTRVSIETALGKSYVRELHPLSAMLSDHSSHITFGLGAQDSVRQVIIEPLNGDKRVINNPEIDTVLSID